MVVWVVNSRLYSRRAPKSYAVRPFLSSPRTSAHSAPLRYPFLSSSFATRHSFTPLAPSSEGSFEGVTRHCFAYFCPFVSSLLSSNSKLPILEALCFDIHTNCRGWV